MKKCSSEVLARLIGRCDKDFRPIRIVDQWSKMRANFIITELLKEGFEVTLRRMERL